MPTPVKDNCPLCYLTNRVYEPLMMQGPKNFPCCAHGHEYPEREDLTLLMTQAFPKPTPAPVPFPPRSPQPVQQLDSHPPKLNLPGPKGAPDESREEKKQTSREIPTESSSRIGIDEINYVRMSDILGHFTDASSMYGAIFALHQELLDTKELLQRAETSKKVAEGPRRVGGDAVIQLIIPERHVESVRNIAEANSLDETRFMNSAVELGLDNGWFFTIFIAIGGSFLWQLAQSASTII
jgi:hypothetical protein